MEQHKARLANSSLTKCAKIPSAPVHRAVFTSPLVPASSHMEIFLGLESSRCKHSFILFFFFAMSLPLAALRFPEPGHPVSWAETKPCEPGNKSCQLKRYRKRRHLWVRPQLAPVYHNQGALACIQDLCRNWESYRIKLWAEGRENKRKRKAGFLPSSSFAGSNLANSQVLGTQGSASAEFSLSLWPNLNPSHPDTRRIAELAGSWGKGEKS